MLTRRNFIFRNKKFTCRHCGKMVAPLRGSCRNHCPGCLSSLHVDEAVPGDRASRCGGLMRPINVEQSGKKGFILIHQCERCGKIQKNKVAADDEWEEIVRVSSG